MDALNRVATEWLVARFVGAPPVAGDDSFGILVEEHFADDVAMKNLAKIVRGAAAPERFDVMPESAGLRAIVAGCVAANLPPSSTAAVLDALLATLRQRVASGEDLECHALLDATTGIPNRFLFLDRLTHAIAFAHRHDTLLAVCSIRFDFREVSGSVPRLAREIVDRLRSNVREIDTVARLSTDEFSVIVTDVSKREHAEVAIGKLTAILAEPYDIGERAWLIDAHLGVSLYPRHGHDATSLLQAAREAAAAGRTVSVFGEP